MQQLVSLSTVFPVTLLCIFFCHFFFVLVAFYNFTQFFIQNFKLAFVLALDFKLFVVLVEFRNITELELIGFQRAI